MNITQEHQHILNEVLEVIRWTVPGSHPVIGGGALRDHILGRPIKDIDVFVSTRDVGPFLVADTSLLKKINCSPMTAQYGRKDMHGAWDFQQVIEGFAVQVILADFEDKRDLAHTFDLGLSRVTFDGTLYVSPEFIQDATDKKFRIRRADNQYELERTYRRIKRLHEKYPEFTLDPEFSGTITRARQDVPLGLADCVTCKTKIGTFSHFRNAISLREYAISGMCQKCQDSVFGPD